jgi:hypothetical protein
MVAVKEFFDLHIYLAFPSIMLYLIGLGLSDEKDITVKGLEVGPLKSHSDSCRQ